MSGVVQIATATRTYDAVLDTRWLRATFVTGTLVDEVTGAPVEAASVRTDLPGVLARVVAGGYFAASGLVERVFPDHATLPSAITLTFSAPRYRSRTVTVAIPAASLFPVSGGVVQLRPLPVRLEGRVTKEADHAAGIAGAEIAVKSGTKALLLRTTAHADHASGVTIRAVTFANAGGVRHVVNAVRGGAMVVTLDNVAGLAGGSILRFGANEYAVVDSVSGADVTLRYALTRTSAAGANVQGVTATVAVGSTTTTRSIDAGDGLLVLAAALNAAAIEINDAAALEYHETGALADGDGFYAADGIVGLPTLTLTASKATFQPLDADIQIDTSRPVAALSFRLKP